MFPPVLTLRVGDMLGNGKKPDHGTQESRETALPTRAWTGSRISVVPVDLISKRFARHGFWDWRNVCAAACVLRLGDVVLDVGANIGSETICFSDLVGMSGKVIAFEPLPENAARLRRLSREARYQNILVNQSAVGEEEGTAWLTTECGLENSGASYIERDPIGSEGIRVPLIRLDAVESFRRPVRLLHVDVEGAELAVLKGAERVVCENRPIIIVEAVDRQLRRFDASSHRLQEWIADKGYCLAALGKLGLSQDLHAVREPSNWICVHEKDAILLRQISRAMKIFGLLPCFSFTVAMRARRHCQ